MPVRYDLAVVVGGIIGAWALYLSSRRYQHWQTVLIDRFKVGDGATAHSAGVLLPTGRSERERSLAASSARLYGDVRAALGLQSSQADVLWVVDADGIGELQAAAVGFPIDEEIVEPTALAARLPTSLRISGREVVLRGGTASSHNPGQIAESLVNAALRSPDISCLEGVAVTDIRANGADTELMLDGGGSLIARKVLLAIGPWLKDGPTAGFANSYGIRIKKVVALHVNRLPAPNAAAIFFPKSDAYLMPIPSRNEWLFSFRSDEWDCQPRKHGLEISGRDRNNARSILDRYLPGLAGACIGGRVFCDAYARDGEPVVAFDRGNLAVVAGAGGGAGFRLAPGIAEAALQMLVG